MIIDGIRTAFTDEKNILQVIRKAGIHVPTFCYYTDMSIYGACRMCVVEDERGSVIASCSTPPKHKMVIRTNTSKLHQHRKMILELLLASHCRDCTVCEKNGNCRLQMLAARFHLTKVRFPNTHPEPVIDDSSLSIVRDPSKCILCGDCVRMCNEVQHVGAIDFAHRGANMIVSPAFGRPIAETDCVNCGQCIQVCPVGALSIRDNTDEVYDQIAKGKHVVAQIAPSVRITLAESLGYAPGTVTTGKIIHAMRKIGFSKVFDSDFTADLTIMEEGNEFLNRLKNGGTLPMMTSCCPAWVKYCETYGYEQLSHLSSAKSPQQMFGAVIKTYYAKKAEIDPKNICSVSVMPCTAKKFECKRPEMCDSGYQDVDISITVEELAKMIRTAGIHFDDLEDQEFDSPFGLGSGAGQIFGTTGGVMEAALRTVYEVVTGETLPRLEFDQVRGTEGIREAEIDLNGMKVRVAVVHGLSNARKVLDEVKAGTSPYQFIEVMACEGGCIGGGGNAPKTRRILAERRRAIYEEDRSLPIRKSHENPYVQRLYEEYLGEPLGERSHKLLHTTYHSRRDLLR